MLPLYNFNIVFNQSQDYSRCVIVAHIAAIALLLQSCFSPIFMTLCFIGLLISLKKAYRVSSTQTEYRSLTYSQSFWILEDHDKRSTQYESARIAFDGGFFLLLQLNNKLSKKSIVIFNDQISKNQRRCLSVLTRIL